MKRKKITINQFMGKKQKKLKNKKRKRSIIIKANKKYKKQFIKLQDFISEVEFICQAKNYKLSQDGRWLIGETKQKLGIFVSELFSKNSLFQSIYLAKQCICKKVKIKKIPIWYCNDLTI